MYQQKRNFLVLILWLWMVPAHARWVSTGGELIKDSHNPWFLPQNTTQINYCMQVSPISVSISEERAAVLVERAFTYWISEFKRVRPYFSEGMFSYLGEPSLKQIPCTGTEDVKFQLGFDTLTFQQRRFIKNNSAKFLTLAVRTDYDEVNLKGRGFVFVASDIGPRRFKGEKGGIERPWSTEGLLYRVLLHEVGHVFGIPHVDNGVFEFGRSLKNPYIISIMSSYYPEFILKNPENYKSENEPPGFFGFLNRYERCGIREPAKRYFLLNSDWDCIRVEMDLTQSTNGTDAEIKLSSIPAPGSLMAKDLGVIILSNITKKDDIVADLRTLVVVHLTPAQKIFTLPKGYPFPYVIGPSFLAFNMSGVFRSHTGESKPMLMRLDQERIQIQGVESGQIRMLLD